MTKPKKALKVKKAKSLTNLILSDSSKTEEMSHVIPDALDLAQQETLMRLKRAVGHLNAVVTMVENKRSCGDVLQQLSAVISALGGARISLLQGHINTCLKNNLKPGHEDLVKELDLIIQRGMKI